MSIEIGKQFDYENNIQKLNHGENTIPIDVNLQKKLDKTWFFRLVNVFGNVKTKYWIFLYKFTSVSIIFPQ